MRKPPPEHTRWKPGQSGNKAGRPKGIVRKDEIQAMMGRFWQMDVAEIEKYMNAPGVSAGERLVASVVMSAIKGGDAAKAEWLLTRLVGKVKDELEVSTPKPFIAQYRDGTAEVMGVEEPKALPEGEDK